MTSGVKSDVISSVVSIGYYWMGEQNQQAAEAVIGLLRQISTDEIMAKKVNDLETDFKIFFHIVPGYVMQIPVEIPEGKNEEQKLLWLSGVCLMNIFKVGDFEMAYTFLMDMSVNWNELYVSVIETIKKEPSIKNELAKWLMTHFYMACDLLGSEEINMMGFKVTKTE